MTDEKMLRELIGLAERNGYKFWNLNKDYVEFIEDEMIWQYKKGHGFYASVTDLLFDHDFAKAVFGEEECRKDDKDFDSMKKYESDLWGSYGDYWSDYPAHFIGNKWQYHLQQMVLEPEEYRIKYTYENRIKL